MDNTVYIKISGCILTDRKQVQLKDIATVHCNDKNIESKMAALTVFSVKSNKRKKYVISSLKVIELMSKQDNSVSIVNLGENDFIIEYTPYKEKGKVFEWIKTAIVALAVFFGGGFTIITFNEDVSVEKVFDMYKNAVCEDVSPNDKTMEIAYSIGLPIGILVFFNHISKKKFTSDPTPLQVQLRTYEKDTNSAIIDNASREGNEIDAG